MGWFGIYKDYKNVAEYAANELNWDGKETKQLDRAVINSYVYTLVEVIGGINKGKIFIGVDRVERKDGQWMHKSFDENCGPYAYDCPERILKRSNQTSIVSTKWREKCRSVRSDKALSLKLVKLLPKNVTFKSKYFGELTYLYMQNATGSKIVCRDNTGSVYAYKLNNFSIEELNTIISKG